MSPASLGLCGCSEVMVEAESPTFGVALNACCEAELHIEAKQKDGRMGRIKLGYSIVIYSINQLQVHLALTVRRY